MDEFAALENEVRRQEDAEKAARAIAAARAKLILGRDAKAAFFACLALRLRPEADPAVETMATDGRVLAYAPAFVAGLSQDELVGVIAHEVMHNATSHPTRQNGRDPRMWNVACDLAINPLLLEAGFVLPKDRVEPGKGSYPNLEPGRSAEEYYAHLSANGHDDEGRPDPGGCGGVRPPSQGDAAEAAQTEAEWQVAVAQAEAAAKGRGQLPAGIGRMVDAVVRPPADWRAVLREFVSQAARNDYSWSRPNRRYVAQGLYLPGLRSEELGHVVVAVDTSGSVGPDELALFGSELDGILSAFDCTASVVYHDDAVQHVQTWRSADGPLVLEAKGGGGTSHAPVFEWVERQDEPPACVVCLTDLCTEFPDSPPAVPVLWAVTGGNRTEPPFGRRISLEVA